LAWVAAQHLLDELLILRIELEGNRQVVLGRVAVLYGVLEECFPCQSCCELCIPH
jgi:hypothetical protein